MTTTPSDKPGPVDDDDHHHHDDASSSSSASSLHAAPLTRERTTTSSLRRTASNVLSAVASRVTTRGWPEPPPPPDGGLQAWTQVACGWLTVFVTWGYINSFGSFQTYYEESASLMPGTPPSTISWIGSVQIWLTMVGGIFTGRLLDAGYFVPTFAAGAVLQVLGMFLMSAATRYWQLMLTQGLLTGLGGGIFFTPALALVATYFDKRRGLAFGLVTTGNSAGGIVYPLVTRQLLPKLGFAWTARVLAFINLGALTVCCLFMRPRLPPRKSGPFVDWSAFREPVFNFFIVGWWLLNWANYYTFYYIASYGTQALAMPYATASILVIIINGVALPFRVLVPACADRCPSPLDVLVPVTFAWAAVAFCWPAVSSSPGYFAWTAVYGALAGAFQCLVPTSVASITPRLDRVGTRMGMSFGIISFASALGPPVGGALQRSGAVRASEYFLPAQIWAACATLVGAALCLVARWAISGFRVSARIRAVTDKTPSGHV